MNRKFLIASDQIQLDHAAKLLAEGWEIDPIYEGKPIRLEWSVIFPLILYESDLEHDLGEAAKEKAELKVGDLDDVESLKDVLLPDVDRMLGEGYRLLSKDHVTSKIAVMVKRRKPVPAGVV